MHHFRGIQGLQSLRLCLLQPQLPDKQSGSRCQQHRWLHQGLPLSTVGKLGAAACEDGQAGQVTQCGGEMSMQGALGCFQGLPDLYLQTAC